TGDEVHHERPEHAYRTLCHSALSSGSATWWRAASRMPSEPPGWYAWKSESENALSVISAAASASPRLSVTVVDVVGASPRGSASRSTRVSSTTVEIRPSGEAAPPAVMPMIGI